MVGELRNRLQCIAATQQKPDRERLEAALLIGARIALARVREIGGTYPSGIDVDKAVRELLDHEQDKGVELPAPADTPPLADGPSF